MTTERDPRTRIVLSWLREDAHENAERVLLRALDEVDTTPQRRAWWPAWRTDRMKGYLNLAAAAAAVLVVAVVVYQFLPGGSGPGGPTVTPSPSRVLIARGNFFIRDWDRVEFEATREGSSVTGRMTVGLDAARRLGEEHASDFLSVDLRCARTTEDGLIMIGGYTDGAGGRFAGRPDGTLAAIVLKRGSPVKAQIWEGSLVNVPETQTTDCLAYLDGWLTWTRTSLPGDDWLRDDIEGTVEFGQSEVGPSVEPTVTLPPFGLAGNGDIAVAKDGDILVADRPGGGLRPLVVGHGHDRDPVFSPDGTRLAFVRDTPQGSFLMVAHANGTNVIAFPLEAGSYLSFAPDGRSLIGVGSFDGDVQFFIRPVDPAAATVVLDILPPPATMLIEPPLFNPTNANEILVVGRFGQDSRDGLHVYELATGEIRTLVGRHVHDVAWLPDGERLIYSTDARPHMARADGSADQALASLNGRVSPVSNDGTKIVAERGGEGPAGPRLEIVPIEGDGQPVVLACGPGHGTECPRSWIWAPDDSMLIGIVFLGEGTDENPWTERYVLVDAATGHVTELEWIGEGRPAWQRVFP